MIPWRLATLVCVWSVWPPTAGAQQPSALPLDRQVANLVAQRSSAQAMVALDRLIVEAPADAATLDAEATWALLRWIRETQGDGAADQRILSLARIGFGGENHVDSDAMAIAAVDILLARDEVAESTMLAARVTDRLFLESLLTRRRYERLWPELESRVGDQMQIPLSQAVTYAEARMRRATGSVKARSSLLDAYVAADRLVDAEKVGADFAKTPGDTMKLDENGAWLVDAHARVLIALNRLDDADRRYEQLRVLHIENAPWIISMMINRAEYLVRQGRATSALPLILELESLAPKFGSPYAVQLVRRMRSCAAKTLSQKDATALADDFLAHMADAPVATVEGMMCLARQDEAARQTILLLKDEDNRDAMIGALLPKGAATDPSEWGASKLLELPSVLAAFQLVARRLPPSVMRATSVQ